MSDVLTHYICLTITVKYSKVQIDHSRLVELIESPWQSSLPDFRPRLSEQIPGALRGTARTSSPVYARQQIALGQHKVQGMTLVIPLFFIKFVKTHFR